MTCHTGISQSQMEHDFAALLAEVHSQASTFNLMDDEQCYVMNHANVSYFQLACWASYTSAGAISDCKLKVSGGNEDRSDHECTLTLRRQLYRYRQADNTED